MRLTTLPTDPPRGPHREPEPPPRPVSSPGRGSAADRAHRVDAPPQGSGLVAALTAGLVEIRARIAAATPAGHTAPRLLAVTKSVAPATALTLARLLHAEQHGGASVSGSPATAAAPVELAESRAADLAAKAAHLRAAAVPARWHFIGHVQRNKARRIVEHADVIQSLDSLRLAETLERAAADLGKVLDVFVQVDFTGEPTKTGLDADGAREVLRYAARAPHLRPLGLMALGPLHEAPQHAAPGLTTAAVFACVAALARELEADPELAAAFPGGRAELSLGMSGDLERAIAAGSTLVRIGSDLFRHLAPEAAPGAAGEADDVDLSRDDRNP